MVNLYKRKNPMTDNKRNIFDLTSFVKKVNTLFTNNMKHMIEVEKTRGNNTINEEKILDHIIKNVGMSPHIWRERFIKGFYND